MQEFEPTVLIVDDDEAVRRILVQLLTSRGYPVTEAADGNEAWAQLLDEPHDVVVSDLQMPQCDGRELCERIRGEPTLRDIRIVIISGGSDIPDARELKCDSVLRKPVSLQMLLHEVALARAPAAPRPRDTVTARQRARSV
jgi:CheY-like chemotaxis protein